MSFHVLTKFNVVYGQMLLLLGTLSPRPSTGAPSLDTAGGLHPPEPMTEPLLPPKFHLKLRLW